MSAAETIFWIFVFLLSYVYFGYPTLVILLARLIGNKPQGHRHYEPTVSLVIAAYNEEKVIAKKIENSLSLNYPKDKLEIIVFSDASTDRTDEIVKSYEPQGVKLIRIEGRQGKVFCKNAVAEMANGEVLVFSDANTMYEPGALKHLVKHFVNPKIGCVAGELRYKHKGGVVGESFYWKYEQWIKRCEGRLGNLTTVNGAIYAVKKSYYKPLPIDVPDDFGITLSIKAQGLKVIHEPRAIAYEETASSVRAELQRRVRMVRQASYALFGKPEFRALLNPLKHGLFAIQLWSHKVLRWFTGAFLLIALVLNIPLWHYGLSYKLLLCGQTFFYGFALLGIIQEYLCGKPAPKIAHIAGYFVLSSWAMLKGLWYGIRGKTVVTWTPPR